jgi:hypothetical protein
VQLIAVALRELREAVSLSEAALGGHMERLEQSLVALRGALNGQLRPRPNECTRDLAAGRAPETSVQGGHDADGQSPCAPDALLHAAEWEASARACANGALRAGREHRARVEARAANVLLLLGPAGGPGGGQGSADR